MTFFFQRWSHLSKCIHFTAHMWNFRSLGAHTRDDGRRGLQEIHTGRQQTAWNDTWSNKCVCWLWSFLAFCCTRVGNYTQDRAQHFATHDQEKNILLDCTWRRFARFCTNFLFFRLLHTRFSTLFYSLFFLSSLSHQLVVVVVQFHRCREKKRAGSSDNGKDFHFQVKQNFTKKFIKTEMMMIFFLFSRLFTVSVF